MTIEAAELSVIAPCFNEELNVELLARRTLDALRELPVPAELILVDDGSRDGTWAKIQEVEKALDRVRGFHHVKNKGIVGGWITGLSGSSAPLVCLIDSDLQNRPEDIPRLYEVFAARQVDIVQAVRHPKGKQNRFAFSRGLNTILNVTFGMNLRDNKSGFIVTRRELLLDILGDAEGYRYFQSFIGVAAGARGLRFAEVDTDFDLRNAGESFLSNFPIEVSLRICGELARYRLETWRKRSR